MSSNKTKTSYNKTRNIQSTQKTPYVRPPQTRKHIPCYCQSCKGKLVDPRTKEDHDDNNIIIPQRKTVDFSQTPEISLDDLISSDLDSQNNIEVLQRPQESQEENYSFLVKRTSDAFQKSRTSKILLPEVINELLSDDDGDDDGDDAPDEEGYERNFEDDTLEYSSDDDLEEDQVNFDAPEIELEENDSGHDEGLDNNSLWIVLWILKFQERFRLSNVAIDSLFKFFH